MKNKRLLIGLGLIIGVVAITWISFTYRFEKFPLVWDRQGCGDEGDAACTSWVYEWIISLPRKNAGLGTQVCFNDFPLGEQSFERIYVLSYGGGYSNGYMYFDKEGQYISSETSDDTGQFYRNGMYAGNIFDENPPKSWIYSFRQCTFVPEWFFNMKVDRDSAKER